MLEERALTTYLTEDLHWNKEKVSEFLDEYRIASLQDKSEVIYSTIGKQIYREMPVDIKTFMEDPYFLGSIYTEIFPMWKKMLQEIYPAPFLKAYNEVILSCALRAGKTTCEAISVLYEMYLLMCMINPSKTLLGRANASIVFSMLSKDNSTAISQMCDQIQKCLSMSPYFQEQVEDKLSFSTVDKKGTNIAAGIVLKAGSGMSTVVGTDLICGVLDEANIKPTGMAAETFVQNRLDLYKYMLDRRKATYDKAPYMTGIMWLTSSPEDEIDVLGERIKEVEAQKLQNVMIKDNIARWDTRGTESRSFFPLFLGSVFKDPCIVDDTPGLVLTDDERKNIIMVPEEYRNNFRDDMDASIRNIAGRRTAGAMPLFRSGSIFPKVFFREDKVFTKDELIIDLDNLNTVTDYLVDKDYFKHPPKPKCYRYIHLDIASKQDRFGIASVYSDMVKYTGEDGSSKYMRKYYEEFTIGIKAAKGGTVDILRVLEWVYGLKKLGFPIKVVTTDSHQGELARQIIAKYGIKTEYLSVEDTKNKYYNLKNLILTESLEGHRNEILVGELRKLKDGIKKVEKVKGSTDDMSDALCGASWSCFSDGYFKFNDEEVLELVDTLNNRPNISPSNGMFNFY